MTELTQAQPVILYGGSGTRLWPLSRAGFPKQFLSLTGKESLFQQAALRLSALDDTGIDVAKPIIVTGEEHRFLAAEQLREMGIDIGAALLEPAGSNTAPALTLAALAAQQDVQTRYLWSHRQSKPLLIPLLLPTPCATGATPKTTYECSG